MSKYRIVIRSSPKTFYLGVGFYLILLLSIWFWQPDVMKAQWLVQSLATIVIILLFVQFLNKSKTNKVFSDAKVPTTAYLDTSDDRVIYHQDQNVSGYISNKSLLFGPFIYLHIQLRVSNRSTHSLWLCKDQMSELDFRRLCRSVIRMRTQGAQGEHY